MIKKYRHKIDKFDDRIIKLLKKRMAVVEKIKEEKKKENIQIHDETREKEILEKVQRKGEEYGDYLKEIYACVLEQSKRLQRSEDK